MRVAAVLLRVKEAVKTYPFISVQAFSGLKKTGLDELTQKLNEWYSGA